MNALRLESAQACVAGLGPTGYIGDEVNRPHSPDPYSENEYPFPLILRAVMPPVCTARPFDYRPVLLCRTCRTRSFACSGVAWPEPADLCAPPEAPWAHLFGAANVPNLDR